MCKKTAYINLFSPQKQSMNSVFKVQDMQMQISHKYTAANAYS